MLISHILKTREFISAELSENTLHFKLQCGCHLLPNLIIWFEYEYDMAHVSLRSFVRLIKLFSGSLVWTKIGI